MSGEDSSRLFKRRNPPPGSRDDHDVKKTHRLPELLHNRRKSISEEDLTTIAERISSRNYTNDTISRLNGSTKWSPTTSPRGSPRIHGSPRRRTVSVGAAQAPSQHKLHRDLIRSSSQPTSTSTPPGRRRAVSVGVTQAPHFHLDNSIHSQSPADLLSKLRLNSNPGSPRKTEPKRRISTNTKPSLHKDSSLEVQHEEDENEIKLIDLDEYVNSCIPSDVREYIQRGPLPHGSDLLQEVLEEFDTERKDRDESDKDEQEVTTLIAAIDKRRCGTTATSGTQARRKGHVHFEALVKN